MHPHPPLPHHPHPLVLTDVEPPYRHCCRSLGQSKVLQHNKISNHHIHSFNSSLPIIYMEVMKLMEAPPYYAPPQHHDSSRPTISFPLGTALLLIVLFSLSGIFSCCYHWDKLRHLRGDFSDEDPDSDDLPSKPKPIYSESKREEDQSLPVIMPGDQFARFIAMPCPCEPPRQGKITVEETQTPPKPPHIAIPMH